MSEPVKYTYTYDIGMGSPLTNKGELCHLKDFYCPKCGKQEVYEDQLNDDYYEGYPHICFACKNKFYMNGFIPVTKIEEGHG